MPTVPRRDPASTVRQQPLRVPQATAAPTEETFGGGASGQQVSQAREAFVDTSTKLLTQLRDNADKTIAQEFDVAAVKKKNELLLDVQKNYRRANAPEALDYVTEEWTKFVGEQREAMPNRRIAGLTQNRYTKYFDQMYTKTQVHMASEYELYADETSGAVVHSSTQNAALNWEQPQVVADAKAMITATIANRTDEQGYPLEGEGKEVYENRLQEAYGNLHKEVINAMLADGKHEEAQAYWENNQDELGDDAKTYKGFIRTEKTRIQTEQKNALKLQQDETNRKLLLDSFEGKGSLSEVQRLFKLGELSEADLKAWESRLVSPDFQDLRARLNLKDPEEPPETYSLISNPEVFNRIRQLQLQGDTGKYEIDRMIRDNGSELSSEDQKFLSQENNGAKDTPRSKEVRNQAERIREWAKNYIKTGLTSIDPKDIAATALTQGIPAGVMKARTSIVSTEDVDATAERLVTTFHREVLQKQAQSKDQIKDIAAEVINDEIRKEDPSLSGYANMSDIVVDVNHKVKQLFTSPFKKDRPKAQYTITRNQLSPEANEPKKEKKEE